MKDLNELLSNQCRTPLPRKENATSPNHLFLCVKSVNFVCIDVSYGYPLLRCWHWGDVTRRELTSLAQPVLELHHLRTTSEKISGNTGQCVSRWPSQMLKEEKLNYITKILQILRKNTWKINCSSDLKQNQYIKKKISKRCWSCKSSKLTESKTMCQ